MHRSIKGQNERDLVCFNVPRHWAIMYSRVRIGAVVGFRRGRGVLIGTIAGTLLFGLVIGVGSLAGWRNGRSK